MIPAAGTMRLKTMSGRIVEVEERPRMAKERPRRVDRLSKNREKRPIKSPDPKVMPKNDGTSLMFVLVYAIKRVYQMKILIEGRKRMKGHKSIVRMSQMIKMSRHR